MEHKQLKNQIMPKYADCFIATYDEYCGQGSSLETAFSDLKENVPSSVELNDVEFFEATRLDVELKLIVVTDNVD